MVSVLKLIKNYNNSYQWLYMRYEVDPSWHCKLTSLF